MAPIATVKLPPSGPELPEPNMDWYLSVSRERGVTPRCPFASVERCPRYYQSLSLLGKAGSTKIPEEEDQRLLERWEKSEFWPRTEEYASCLSGNEEKYFSYTNFCPEVIYDRFGVFASSLHDHFDEIDRDFAHQRLSELEHPPQSWQWRWAGLTPRHFTECELYSLLSQRSNLPKEATAVALSKTWQHELTKVFVVHGHDEGARETVARFLERIELDAIILQEQPDQGLTIIEKFEMYASQVGFSVVLLTPDDFGGPIMAASQAARARQNVIFELGYFVGKLGRGRACLLRKGDVEIPSDLHGVIYADLDSGGGWKLKLARELQAAGLTFDANRVFG